MSDDFEDWREAMRKRMRRKPDEFQKLRWQRHRQSLAILAAFGFIVEGMDRIDAATYKARFLAGLDRRLTHAQFGRESQYRGTNAARAADIWRKGTRSRWYQARRSTASAGSDTRGIRWYLDKWQREHGVAENWADDTPPAPKPGPRIMTPPVTLTFKSMFA